MHDVLVIGAGPVGSYTAELLAGSGYQVAVLEQREKPQGRSCCTGILGRECLERFPVPSQVVLRPVNSATFFSPSGKRLRVCREKPQAYIVDREAFDGLRVKRAEAQGAGFFWGHRILEARATRGGILVTSADNGSRVQWRGRALVIANGFASRLPRQLALGSPPDFVMGAQQEVALADVDEVEIYLGQEVAPGFFGWLVPTVPGRGRLGLLSRRHPGTYLARLYQRLHAQGKVVAALTPPSFGGIPLKPLPRSYASRVLVVGDAAGQVKPTTGGGIYYGLLCAQAAAATLERALAHDDLSERHLAHYERSWKRRLYRELRIGYYARRLYEKAGDAQIDRLFDLAMSNGIHEALLHSDGFSFDWHGNLILEALTHHAMQNVVRLLRKRLLAR